ncbi:hypothetical protein ACIBG7_17130 [Nonomuraea sp. NPDC050328]|uniref:DUF7144 family membrane protein n=1 Tax=Nonomuraea sp. NPDC050328 TaxID=3364361 RepID=UPI00379E8CBC
MAKITGWVGWIWFAGMMLIMNGLFNVITGLYAIFDDQLYVPSRFGLLLFDRTGWGWVHLILGFLLVIVGMAVSVGRGWARFVSVILVMINALTQLVWIAVNPWWSLIIIVLDVFILYALIVHGKEAEELS